MNAYDAYKIADRVKAELAPLCERIEIAGSLRRGCAEVGDIDFVILPKARRIDEIKARCEKKCAVVQDGEQRYTVRMPNQLKLDIAFARMSVPDLLQKIPGNFGALMLYFTGSKNHNIFICQRAESRGFKFDPFKGVLDGEGYVIASETEEEIFDMLALDFVPPANRERI